MKPASLRPCATFVTCLFDLPRWDRDQHVVARRPRQMEGEGGYFSLAQDLLRQPVPLVIFTEEHLLDRLIAIRPPDARTRYHTLQLTELPLFAQLYSRLCELFSGQYYREVNSLKDTPSYLLVVNSKWSLLRQVADSNPYETPYIGWIDVGLRHVVGADIDLLPLLAGGGAHHPSSLCLAMPHLNAHIPPRDDIMRRFWGRISGGLMTMPTAHAATWEQLCTSFLLDAVRAGYYPFEGELLLRLLLRMGRLIGEPDEDVTLSEMAAVPEIRPYRAEYSQLISRHPAVMGVLSSSASNR